ARRVRAVVEPLVARFLLQAVDETERSPSQVVVDRRALARPPAKSDHRQRGSAAVQAILPIARCDAGLAFRRTPVPVLDPAPGRIGDELLQQRLHGRDDLPLVALAPDDALEAVDEAIERRIGMPHGDFLQGWVKALRLGAAPRAREGPRRFSRAAPAPGP